MIYFSEKIADFLFKIRRCIKEILINEMGLKVHGERFYNKQKTHSYPISLVAFDHKKVLGYFDCQFYELGFHLSLMKEDERTIQNVVRHELAHYYAFILYGSEIDAHGKEFRSVCSLFGWGEKIYRSCMEIEQSSEEVDDSEVIRKIKKLLALGASSNSYEAESAVVKARELLIKNNLQRSSLESEDRFFMKRILQQGKMNAKLRSIAKIIETFFVSVVFHSGKNSICLEILGSKSHVEIAEYVASFLDHHLDLLWVQAQKDNPLLFGLVAKNSFFLGVAKGYCSKIDHFCKQERKNHTQEIIVLENQLCFAKKLAYPSLRNTKSQGKYCPKSSIEGEARGKSLNINEALSNKNAKMFFIN